MIARGKKLNEITDFWSDVPKKFVQCKCGAKAVVHGYCQKHWESEGKALHLKAFEKEAATMKHEKYNYYSRFRQSLQRIWG